MEKKNKNIYKKLSEARVLLQEKKIKKSGLNKFAGFKYYELGDFLPEINVIFKELKIISIFNLTAEKAVLEVINAESPEEKIKFETFVTEVSNAKMDEIQKLGSQHTYLKRYLYLNALEIVENDLVDASEQQQKKPKEKVNFKNLQKVVEQFAEFSGEKSVDILKNYKIKNSSTQKEVDEVANLLNKKIIEGETNAIR